MASTYTTPERALAAKYPFVALPTADGDGFEIVFPDIAGVVGFSETWEGIGAEAQSILSEWIELSAEDGHPIPAPSGDWSPIERELGDFTLPDVYSAQDVADVIGVSIRRVYALAKSRNLGQHIGAGLAFTLDDINAMRERKPGRPRKTAATT